MFYVYCQNINIQSSLKQPLQTNNWNNEKLDTMYLREENHAILGYYAASSGNFLLTFRDLSVPSLGVKNPNETTQRICVFLCIIRRIDISANSSNQLGFVTDTECFLWFSYFSDEF
jgi:hypothetical protein